MGGADADDAVAMVGVATTANLAAPAAATSIYGGAMPDKYVRRGTKRLRTCAPSHSGCSDVRVQAACGVTAATIGSTC